ncbi:MAG: MipA/OmpV family protein [Alcanivoracaceae bacterium]|nr:MipA/OmpV family protein [Alcanivoracaceae bacterium]
MMTSIFTPRRILISAAFSFSVAAAQAAPVSVDSSAVREAKTDDTRFGIGATTSINQRPFLGVGTQQESLPYFSFSWGRIAVEGLDITVDLFRNDQQSFGFIATPRFYEVTSGFAKEGELNGISSTDDTWFAGLNYRRKLGSYYIIANAITDVGNESDGNEVTLTVNRPYHFDRVSLIPAIGVVWQDKKLVNHFYGVDNDETTPTRSIYQNESSLNYQASLTAVFQPSTHWQFLGAVKVDALGSGISDSPIIDEDVLPSALVGAVYRF